jgi:HEAT repeat protein
MKQFALFPIALALLLALHSPSIAAETNEEHVQIAILVSGAPRQDKEAACARLKRIGTGESVSALSLLLNDETLANPARNALEFILVPQAAQAFIKALDKTSGLQKIGVINSLGNRREIEAVPALSKLLKDPDPAIVSATAAALGKIGSPKAIVALTTALGADSTNRTALSQALLIGAERRLGAGDRSKAKSTFKALAASKDDAIRAAAFTGFLQASGDAALKDILVALEESDHARQEAALRVALKLKNPKTGKALGDLLPKVSPLVQVSLLGVVADRADTAAGPAALSLARSQDFYVRIAALTALGSVGDTSALPILADAALSKNLEEQRAARQSLLDLRGGQVNEAILAQLPGSKPEIQVQLARALAGRGAQSTVPKLLDLARGNSPAAKSAAFSALASLAAPEHLQALVQLVQNAATEESRSEAGEVVRSVCLRFRGDKSFDLGPVLEAACKGETVSRIAFLEICAGLQGDRVLEVLRTSVKDRDTRIQSVARRTLCESQNPALLPDILAIARNATEPNARTLAIRSYARLMSSEETLKLSAPRRAALLEQALATAQRVEEKRLLLAALAAVPAKEALALVTPYFDSADLQTEAALAAIQISAAIKTDHPDSVRAAMSKVISGTTDASRRATAEAILRALEQQ